MVKHIKPAALLLCISLLSLHFVPAHAQEGFDNRKALYGLHLGFTENRVDIYHTQGGEAYALKKGNHSFYAPGTRISVIWDFRMGDHFRLRAMPGVSLIGRTWVPDNISIPTSPSVEYKVKNVCGELPIGVKWIPFRWGNRQLYLASGLSYSFDFTSFNKDLDEGTIQRLNTHDLRFICGIGYEFDTRFVRLGIELKADCFNILSPNTNGSHSNVFYFNNEPSFSIGFNIEA